MGCPAGCAKRSLPRRCVEALASAYEGREDEPDAVAESRSALEPMLSEAFVGRLFFSSCTSALTSTSSCSELSPFLKFLSACPRLLPSCGSFEGPKKSKASTSTTMISPIPSLIASSGASARHPDPAAARECTADASWKAMRKSPTLAKRREREERSGRDAARLAVEQIFDGGVRGTSLDGAWGNGWTLELRQRPGQKSSQGRRGMCCQRLVAGACNSLSLLTALPFERMLLDGATARAMSYKSGLVGGARMKI